MAAQYAFVMKDMTKSFPGAQKPVLSHINLQFYHGAKIGIVGPNGAGKSTLIDILSGETAPSAGSVELLGADVTRWTQPRRARRGLGRSYQRNTIFPGLTVLENCRLAAQARTQRPWAWWGAAAACARLCGI